MVGRAGSLRTSGAPVCAGRAHVLAVVIHCGASHCAVLEVVSSCPVFPAVYPWSLVTQHTILIVHLGYPVLLTCVEDCYRGRRAVFIVCVGSSVLYSCYELVGCLNCTALIVGLGRSMWLAPDIRSLTSQPAIGPPILADDPIDLAMHVWGLTFHGVLSCLLPVDGVALARGAILVHRAGVACLGEDWKC